ncbi:MAG: transcriptional regulator CynR [Chromatiales bacterium]|nr:transcriptional regulator CynR [Chromatiales bacterium]
MERNVVFPRAIRYLITVADMQSFTRAAEQLFVSQPTLSQQIKQLEDLLDVQLLDRTGRSVQLTAAGEVYLHHARRALRELDEGKRAVHELQDLTRGSLRLGMTPISEHLVAPMLEYFNARHPGITLSTLELPQDAVEANVADGNLDIGIAFSNQLQGETRSNEIQSHVLYTETLHFAVGKGHPRAAQTKPLTTQDLAEEPLVLLNTNFALRQHFDQYCRTHGIEPSISIEANSLSVILEIARFGRLATILPGSIASAPHGLHPIAIEPEMPRHNITLISRNSGYRCPACSAFGVAAALWYHGNHEPSLD